MTAPPAAPDGTPATTDEQGDDDGDPCLAPPPTLWRLISQPESFTVEERHRLEIAFFGCIQDDESDPPAATGAEGPTP